MESSRGRRRCRRAPPSDGGRADPWGDQTDRGPRGRPPARGSVRPRRGRSSRPRPRRVASGGDPFQHPGQHRAARIGRSTLPGRRVEPVRAWMIPTIFGLPPPRRSEGGSGACWAARCSRRGSAPFVRLIVLQAVTAVRGGPRKLIGISVATRRHVDGRWPTVSLQRWRLPEGPVTVRPIRESEQGLLGNAASSRHARRDAQRLARARDDRAGGCSPAAPAAAASAVAQTPPLAELPEILPPSARQARAPCWSTSGRPGAIPVAGDAGPDSLLP